MIADRSAPGSGAARPARPAAVWGRRRSTGHVVAGAGLVVVCAVIFAVTALRVDPRRPVLAVARSVAAGQVLAVDDITTARIVPDTAIQVVPAGRLSSVVGRTARVPLSAGSLLAPGQVGPAAWPPAGQAVAAVAVKAGHAPPGLEAGARVVVLVLPGASTGTANGASVGQQDAVGVARATASVVAVGAPDASGTRAVSLLLAEVDAVQVAVAGGEVALLVEGGGG